MPIYDDKEYIRIIRPLPGFWERDILDIPYVEPEIIDLSKVNNGIWLTGANNMSFADQQSDQKIVHQFKSDKKLREYYNNPKRFLSKAAKYKAVATPDLSMDRKMDFHGIFDATYKNRWLGAYSQANGIVTFPTVGWLERKYDYICFAGLRDGGVFFDIYTRSK